MMARPPLCYGRTSLPYHIKRHFSTGSGKARNQNTRFVPCCLCDQTATIGRVFGRQSYGMVGWYHTIPYHTSMVPCGMVPYHTLERGERIVTNQISRTSYKLSPVPYHHEYGGSKTLLKGLSFMRILLLFVVSLCRWILKCMHNALCQY